MACRQGGEGAWRRLRVAPSAVGRWRAKWFPWGLPGAVAAPGSDRPVGESSIATSLEFPRSDDLSGKKRWVPA